MASRRSPPSPLLRGAAVFGLVLLYALLLRPARPLLTHGLALPALQAAMASQPGAYEIVVRRNGISLEICRAEDGPERALTSWTAPPGLLFLLPGLFLIGLRPRRLDWLLLLASHIGLGVLQVALVTAGVAGSSAGFDAYRFSQTYLTEAVGLGVPVLLYALARREDRRGPSVDGGFTAEETPDFRVEPDDS